MIGNIFNDNKNNALNELLDAISKGIDLLGQENISKELLEVWKRYILSTLELVDTAYSTNYARSFFNEGTLCDPWYMSSINWPNHNPTNIFSSVPNYFPNSAKTAMNMFNNSATNEYKSILQKNLQRLVEIAKRIPKE